MDEKNKPPDFIKTLLDKSFSEECNRELLRVGKNYIEAERDFENRMTERNGTIFLSKLTHGFPSEAEKRDIEIQKDMALRLKDEHHAKADEIYDRYHPKSETEKQAELKEKAEEAEYAKGYNEGYVLKSKEPEMYTAITEATRNIENPHLRLEAFKDSGVDMVREDLRESFKARAKGVTGREPWKSEDKEKGRDFDKERETDIDKNI